MNNKIIEIIGPPGIGKTTIYQELCKIWKPNLNWVSLESLLTPQPHFREIYKWMDYRFRKLLGKRMAKSIPVEYGLRFVDNHQELAHFYWDLLSNPRVYAHKDVNKRFRSAYFLYTDFCRYQAVYENASTKPCMINEGLLQKSFLVQHNEAFMLEIIDRYLPLVPLPHSIISINSSDKNMILERLQSRKKVIASHIGKGNEELLDDIERWQYLQKVILCQMKKRDVPIIHIDAAQPIEENVQIINAALNNSSVLV